MFTQLNPPLPLDTPKGSGLAYGVIDYGPDFDLLWVVFDDATGECWTWPNPKIRAVKNITMGRRTETAPILPRLTPLPTNAGGA
jgi:hypothetical protein